MDIMPGEIDLREDELDGDGRIKLSDLLSSIPHLQKKYGKHAVLRFDGGYNNVSAVITPTKHVKRK